MTKCRNCKSEKLRKIIKVGPQPLSGFFYKKKKFNLKKYSLDLFKCEICSLIQFNKAARSNEMFGDNYEYRTSLSNLMISHIKNKNLYDEYKFNYLTSKEISNKMNYQIFKEILN